MNAKTGVLSILQSKLSKIKHLCLSYRQKTEAMRVQLQKLLGHLLYIYKCIPPARLFMNRILGTLRNTLRKDW